MRRSSRLRPIRVRKDTTWALPDPSRGKGARGVPVNRELPVEKSRREAQIGQAGGRNELDVLGSAGEERVRGGLESLQPNRALSASGALAARSRESYSTASRTLLTRYASRCCIHVERRQLQRPVG